MGKPFLQNCCIGIDTTQEIRYFSMGFKLWIEYFSRHPELEIRSSFYLDLHILNGTGEFHDSNIEKDSLYLNMQVRLIDQEFRGGLKVFARGGGGEIFQGTREARIFFAPCKTFAPFCVGAKV